MDIETLKRFCGDRNELSVPWFDGDHTIATNGHVLIRVRGMVDGAEADTTGRPATAYLFDKSATPPEWFPIPDVTPEPIPTEEVCQECGGEGYTTCPHCGQDMECDKCDGTGRIMPRHKDKPVKVGPCFYSDRYLHLIKTVIPDAEIGPIPSSNEWSFTAALIRFSGGDGLLMPRKDK